MPFEGRARSEPPRLRAAPAASTAAAGLALVLVALAFGAVPLLVPGIGFVLLGSASSAWVWLAADGADVRRSLADARVVEGERIEATIELRRGRLRTPAAAVHDPLAGTPIDVSDLLAASRARRPAAVRITATIERRGRHRFPPPSLWVSDPLGLARACRRGAGAPVEVLVLPRIEPVHWLAPERRRLAAGHSGRTSREQPAAGELDGLREYQEGTSAARIHWPALARGAGLLERRLTGEREAQPLIVLDARAPDTDSARELLDAAVRAAASLTFALARQGGCSLLLPGSRTPLSVGADLAAWPAAHTRLALVAPGGHGPSAGMLRVAASRGPLIWVTANPELEPHPTGAGARELVLVAPVIRGGRPGRSVWFLVSGCAGVAVRASRGALRGRPVTP